MVNTVSIWRQVQGRVTCHPGTGVMRYGSCMAGRGRRPRIQLCKVDLVHVCQKWRKSCPVFFDPYRLRTRPIFNCQVSPACLGPANMAGVGPESPVIGWMPGNLPVWLSSISFTGQHVFCQPFRTCRTRSCLPTASTVLGKTSPSSTGAAQAIHTASGKLYCHGQRKRRQVGHACARPARAARGAGR